MNILIIEDEPLVARDLAALVRKLEPAATISGPLSSVASSRKWLTEHPAPALILSDIQLSDGISFEVFENVKINCPIIFTTAYDAYAIRAFKLNSIDYLLKPIDAAELDAAIRKYKSLTPGPDFSEHLKIMFSQWENEQKKYKDRFLALQRNSLVPVSAGQIGFFRKDELVYIHTMEGEKLISDQTTLDEIESMVDPSQFFRVNRQHLIHIQAVGKIRTTHKGLSVELKPPFNIELDISREKATAFKKWLES